MPTKTPTTIKSLYARFQWAFQVWLCRRFLRAMTLKKAGVLAYVTGLPVATIASMHPSCRCELEGAQP